jgi:hypothetical protein
MINTDWQQTFSRWQKHWHMLLRFCRRVWLTITIIIVCVWCARNKNTFISIIDRLHIVVDEIDSHGYHHTFDLKQTCVMGKCWYFWMTTLLYHISITCLDNITTFLYLSDGIYSRCCGACLYIFLLVNVLKIRSCMPRHSATTLCYIFAKCFQHYHVSIYFDCRAHTLVVVFLCCKFTFLQFTRYMFLLAYK